METKEQTNWHDKYLIKDIISYSGAILVGATLGLAICKFI